MCARSRSPASARCAIRSWRKSSGESPSPPPPAASRRFAGEGQIAFLPPPLRVLQGGGRMSAAPPHLPSLARGRLREREAPDAQRREGGGCRPSHMDGPSVDREGGFLEGLVQGRV